MRIHHALRAASGAGAGLSGDLALSFDGVDDYVDCGTNADVEITGDMTVMFWASIPTSREDDRVVSKTKSASDNGWIFYLGSSGNTTPDDAMTWWYNGLLARNDSLNATDGWHHFAGVFDASSDTLTLYQDGKSVDTGFGVSTLPSNDGIIELGREIDASSIHYSGLLSHVSIWDTVLSLQQIRDYANNPGSESGEAGLKAFWPVTSGSGTTLVDEAGTNDGTINGATWVERTAFPDVIFEALFALSFDGINDFVDINISSLGPTLTFELWVRSSNADSSSYAYFLDSTNRSYVLEWSVGNGQLGFFNGSHKSIAANPSDGNWHHLAYVMDDGAGVGEIFVDAVSVGTAAYSGATDTARSLFAEFDLDQYFWNGEAAEIRVWSTARTQSEIQNNANATLTGTETGLVAYWPTDEGNGSTLTDNAGNNDGTISGATWVERTAFPQI